MERLTPSTTTEHIHVQQPVIPDVLENCFAVTIVTWPHYEQEWHCVHYFVGVFWLTLFRHTPISCILFVPGPTSSTWKHSLQCTYTTLRVCVLHILRELFLLSWCVNKLSLYDVKHVAVHTTVQARTFRCWETSAALFCRRWRLHPEFSLNGITQSQLF